MDKKLEKGGNITALKSVDYKTGSWRKDIPVVTDKLAVSEDPKLALFCPESAIIFKEGKFSHIDYVYCKGCGICAKLLPNAIKMKRS
jgi:2-oxoacid:acceptor oxidoreductase delta subunit (pyruvate/2-ketoisovalerate family)